MLFATMQSIKKNGLRNQQFIVKKNFTKHSVTFYYLLCLSSHNNNYKKLKTMAKAKKAKKAVKKAKKAAKKKK